MKQTIVPAQVTTVEDKIAANLSLNQLLLLASPVFINFALYAVLPPILKLSLYKVIIGIILSFFCFLMAIRIKGQILLTRLLLHIRYNFRPRYYLFNKNDKHLRDYPKKIHLVDSVSLSPKQYIKKTSLKPAISLTDQELISAKSLLDSKRLSFIANKKVGLRVHITEI